MRFLKKMFCIILISENFKRFSATKCESYNETCKSDETCGPIEDCKASHCYVLWKNNTDGSFTVKFKGCWETSGGDCLKQCVERSAQKSKDFLFCCCKGDLCNREFFWEPTPAPPQVKFFPPQSEDTVTWIAFLMLAVVLLVFISFILYMVNNQKLTFFNQCIFKKIPSIDSYSQSTATADLQKLRSVVLIEIIAKGKFGTVWKATMDRNETVAVKKMLIQEKQSWLTEQEIYKLPLMSHANILRFIGAEKRDDTYWLITAYHPLGSLHDFLKANVVTWDHLCCIAYAMARGLTYLHEEIPSDIIEHYKPAIAHRDFKSSNVLLKNDFSACIADFGLALIFQPSKSCGDTHGQVGTSRYMAPEILEGAINFSRDAFLRIDMYACGLVLWELASRCSLQSSIPEYKLPFEEELGNQQTKKQHPTLEDIQDIVVHNKKRPVIRESWRDHPEFSVLCDTIEECWDHDAEARLSASCVMERMAWYAEPAMLANTSFLYNEKKISNNNDISIVINEFDSA